MHKIAGIISLAVLVAILAFNGIALIVNPRWWTESEWTLSTVQARIWLSDNLPLWQFRAFGVVLILIVLALLSLLRFFISTL